MYQVCIVVCAELLLWQPRATRGRWELFTTHTAFTSLLSNPPAVVLDEILCWINLRTRWPKQTQTASFMLRTPYFIKLHAITCEWQPVRATRPPSAHAVLPVTSRCGNVLQVKYKWTSQCPLCRMQMSLPKRPSVLWHSQADFVIILPMHVSLVSAMAQCPCLLLLYSCPHTDTHTRMHPHTHTHTHAHWLAF